VVDMVDMVDMVDRMSKRLNQEPNLILTNLGKYELASYWFEVNLLLTIQVFAGIPVSDVCEVDFEEMFNNLNYQKLEGQHLHINHILFLEKFEEWHIEHILLSETY